MSAAIDLLDTQLWTPDVLADFLAESRADDLDWRRFEIVDGMLVVSPPAIPRHELTITQLSVALHQVAPPGHRVIGSAGIRIGRSYRITDVTVVADRVFESADAVVTPADVLLAVEVESPSSITTDRVTKPAEYAASGIPHYWRVETDPVRLVTYQLDDGVYVETGAWGAGDVAALQEPLRVEFPIDSLMP